MYKGINEFKKGYQHRACVIKKHDGPIIADTSSILSRWEQFFSNLLNVNRSTKVRIGNYLSSSFPIENGLLSNMLLGRNKKLTWDWI